jgi:tetratricopeptide (TPR) repeat protein
MNANVQRAQLLFQQSRHDLAEAELRQALASEPQDAFSHALLGLCVAQREDFKEATAEVRQAIHLQPDMPFAHYAHAMVLYKRHRYDEALAAIGEAIRLDPAEADYFSLLAGIHFEEARWQDALNAAEQGLRFEPEHIGCTNLRAMAMVKLGRKTQAGETIRAALSKNPESAVTHANQGWTLLEQGDPTKAAEHFREALRLDPENDWARRGMVEALKARNIVYALMLKYFLWMGHFSRRGQWGIILGGYFGARLCGVISSARPELAQWLRPIQILYIVFAVMTWMASPFFNLLLRLNKFGRFVLSRDQIVASNWFGICLLLALASLVGYVVSGFGLFWFFSSMVFGFLLLPVSATFKCAKGWPRNVMAALSIGLAVIGVSAVAILAFTGVGPSPGNNALEALGLVLFMCFIIGAALSTWIANFLRSKRITR